MKSREIQLFPGAFATLNGAIMETWQAIGPDLLQDGNEELDNVSALEACLDADHLETHGGENAEEAAKIFDNLCRNNSYADALRYLSNNITLI